MSRLSSGCLSIVKMLFGKQWLSTPALTSHISNRRQLVLVPWWSLISFLCRHLISPYFQPPLLPADHSRQSPALRVPQPHWSSSSGAEPVFVQRIGPARSPLMHWQTVYTCLIEAGVCCAYRAKGLSTTIRTLTALALSKTAASHPLSCLENKGEAEGQSLMLGKKEVACFVRGSVHKVVKGCDLNTFFMSSFWIYILKLRRVAPGNWLTELCWNLARRRQKYEEDENKWEAKHRANKAAL